jgi:signal transduction histidine kinase
MFFITFLDEPFKIEEHTVKHYVNQTRLKILDMMRDVYGVDTSDEALLKAVEEHNEVCRLMTEIGNYRKEENPRITGYEYHILNLITYCCPKGLILPKLRETAQELKTRQPDAKKKYRAKIVVVGSEMDDPDFTSLIEDSGALVVADRYCFGSMPGREEIIINDNEDVLTQICRHYLKTSQCPRFMSHQKVQERRDYIQNLVKEYNAALLSDHYAAEFNNDIWIYKGTSDALELNTPIIYSNGSGDDYVHALEDNFELLYVKAKANGGSYTAMVPTKGIDQSGFKFKIIDDNLGDGEDQPFVFGNTDGISALNVSIHDIDSARYVIFQRANIEPSATVAQTIENQVWFVSIAVIIMAVSLAFILSKLITKPIIRLSEAVKILVNGKYDTEFHGHGYREIEELSDTLNFAARELSKHYKLQEDLISNISHDLRTPLTMIKGYGEMMIDIPDENTPENLQIIVDETARLTDLVNDMLDLTKFQSGSRIPEMKCFCLTEMIRATMFRYEKLTEQQSYKIDFSADEDVYVCADVGMILQVVYNLINNAINYTGDDKYVSVKQTVSDGVVRISVTDTGCGIAEEDIPYIWDRYYMADTKKRRKATVGSGLGLSIVKEILVLDGAEHGIESVIDQGTTVWFELDIADADKDDDVIEL